MKNCNKCGEDKEFSEFGQKRGGLNTICKACHSKYQKEYWQKTEAYEKHKVRVSKYKRARKLDSYGLTEAQVEVGFSSPCELCENRLATALDHDHNTGTFRGFLCMSCNTSLGKLGDSVDGLRKAIVYLERQKQ